MTDKTDKTGAVEAPDPQTEKKEVEAWEGAINRCKQWRDDVAEREGWKRILREYRGKWDFQQQNLDIPVVPVNKIFSWTKQEMARMFFRDPYITVNPKRTEDIGASEIAEQVVNYLWSEIDLKRQVKLALLDALLIGHGWIKVGYTANFGISEYKPPVKRGPGRPAKEITPQVDSNEFVKSENVFAVHYPWQDVLFDPSATWPPHHNARWMAFRWVKPIRAIRDSGIYRNVDKIKSADIAQIYGKTTSDKPAGRDVEMAVGWEIWDRDHGKVQTISIGCPGYLRELGWPDEFKDKDGNPEFPAAMLSFNPIPGEPYPLSDASMIEPLIIEKIKIRAIQLNHLKRWNRQIFMKPGLMTEENKSNFKQAIDGAIVEVQGNPSEDFFIPPYAPVQQDIYGVENAVDRDIIDVSGQSGPESGQPAKIGTRTLGELREVMKGNHTRAEERVDVLEDFLSEIARKVLRVIQRKFDIPKIARIVGTKSIEEALKNRPTAQQQPQAQPGQPPAPQSPGIPVNPPSPPISGAPGQPMTSDFSFSWNKEDVNGDMDVDVLAGSTLPMDKVNKLEILESLAQYIPFFGITAGSPAAKAFGREVLRLVDIKALDPIMDMVENQPPPQPPPDPAMIKAQMDAQEMQMKMKNDQQKAALDQQGQKAKTEAIVLKSQADIAKTKMQMQKTVMESVLGQFGGGNGNQHGTPQPPNGGQG